jgi:hypothetical protein
VPPLLLKNSRFALQIENLNDNNYFYTISFGKSRKPFGRSWYILQVTNNSTRENRGPTLGDVLNRNISSKKSRGLPGKVQWGTGKADEVCRDHRWENETLLDCFIPALPDK